MKVRDKTLDESEYKGRITNALAAICPCKPCFNPHDCGRYVYTGVNQKEWKIDMRCATRHNDGCPGFHKKRTKPLWGAKHIYTSERGKLCKRCGFVKE